MKVLLSVSVVAVALAAAPVAAAAAPPLVRPFAPPLVLHGAGGERHAFWRDGDHGGDFWRHRRRPDFVGPVAPAFGATAEPAGTAPTTFVVATPVTVNVTLAPANVAAAPAVWSAGPKIIEIGRSDPPRGGMPLIIYGD